MKKIIHAVVAFIFLICCAYSYAAHVEVSPKKKVYHIGDEVHFDIPELSTNDAYYHFRLYARYNDGPWTQVTKAMYPSFDFKFKNEGTYVFNILPIQDNETYQPLLIRLKHKHADLQAYLQNKSDEQHQLQALTWSDQFYVGGENNVYVKRISWRPYKVVFKPGEKILFVAEPAAPLESLEFEVSVYPMSEGSWRVIVPWHTWPLPVLTYNYHSPTAIMIRVREKNSFLIPQPLWLGQFFAESATTPYNDFLAVILAHHRNPELSAKILDESVAKELRLASYMLYWQVKNVPLVERIKQAHLLGFAKIDRATVKFTTADGVQLEAALDTNQISDNVITTRFALDNYKDIANLFSEIKSLPEPVQIAALVTYFVYNHYVYSQVGDQFSRPWLGLKDVRSMCVLDSHQLAQLLKNFNDDVKPLSLGFGHGDNIIASHVVVELKYQNQYYILDSTLGRVSVASKESLLTSKKFSRFIIFPQLWNAQGLLQLAPIVSVTSVGEVTETAL